MNKKYLKFILGTAMLLSGIFSVKAQTPGGVTNATPLVWLTPDNYDDDEGVWSNKISGTVGDFIYADSIPVKVNTGYNYHGSVNFLYHSSDAGGHYPMFSENGFTLAAGENITAVFVMKRSTSNRYNYLFSFTNSYTNASISWYSATTYLLGWWWGGGTNRTTTAVSEGLVVLDNANSASGIVYSMNGASGNTSSTSITLTNQKMAIASAENSSTGDIYSFQGTIQEIIILKANSSHLTASDMQKLQSYLAIKYGITLSAGAGDYVASDGTVVWDRTTTLNNGFQNNLFGIGRDDNSGLNQVQSSSIGSDYITLFKGDLGTLNDDYSSAIADDKTYMMFGSNNATGTASYLHSAGAAFANGTIDEKINYRSNVIYKAQLTTAGILGGTQTANIKVASENVRYVLVSADPAFADDGNTRIYKVIDGVANDVLINSGDYIRFAGYEVMPGGVSGYQLDLWINGDNSTATTWRNLNENAQFSVNNPSGGTAPVVQPSRFNFHQELNFAATYAKLVSTANYTTQVGQGYYMFVVSDATASSNTSNTLLGFNNAAGNTSLQWIAPTTGLTATNTLTANWPGGTGRTPGFAEANYPRYGIAAMNIANSNSGPINMYLNGVLSSLTNATTIPTTTNPLVIGNAVNSATGNTNPFNGTIQEVILIRNTSANSPVLSATEIAKINSYLAIKYGIMLYGGSPASKTKSDYVNSTGYAVWDSNNDEGIYNKNIFGIGRDDESGLDQVQSCSVESDYLTVFKGDLETLNNNNSRLLDDNTYLMLGSNGLAGKALYELPELSPFDNGDIENKINYRSNAIYKAQVSINNVSTTGSSMTVNMKVASADALYVLVSANSAFPENATRIYPIINFVASDVLIKNGEYVRVAGYEHTPGGIDMASYQLDLWIDGDNSTATTWRNLNEAAQYSLQMVQNGTAPVVQNSRFNFHQELNFAANYAKLRTTTNYTTQPGQGYYMFVVSDATASPAGTSTLLGFNNATGTGTTNGNTSLQWLAATTGLTAANTLTANWPGTIARNPGFAEANYPRYGIAAMNIANSNSGPINMYLNGVQNSFTITTATNTTNPLVIGSALNSATGNTNPFNGTIQEVILMRNAGNSTVLPATEIAKINSYLAIKYGITLYGGSPTSKTRSNYVNSAGNVVWDATLNAGYHQNVFGIGRDDNSGLYQKQSSSVEDPFFAVFIDSLRTLNSENLGELEDMQYLMIGAHEGDASVSTLSNFNTTAEYENGQIADVPTVGFNIQSPTYKAQITGPSISMSVNLLKPDNNFTHVLISSDPNFTPNNTRTYTIDDFKEVLLGYDSTTSKNYVYIKFVGYVVGPGGVGLGLLLWLRADDENAITTVSRSYTGQTAGDMGSFNIPAADLNNIPAVDSWTDLVRDNNGSHTWRFDNTTGSGTTTRRRPVFERYVKEMNYKPSVRFWGSTGYTSMLINIGGRITNINPDAHTSFFMMNNNFNTGPRIYQMQFDSGTLGLSANGPEYGIEKEAVAGVDYGQGRYRGNAAATGSRLLFNTGSTTIASYYVNSIGGYVDFRFNGVQDHRTATINTGNMVNNSFIGAGVANNRGVQGYMSEIIIYDRLINQGSDGAENQSKIESYMALKYGITLRPSPSVGDEHRFDYKFSNGVDIWPGETGPARFVTFYNRVAAVIRDDATDEDNQHAVSTNVGSLLHIGVAGTALSADGSKLGKLNNLEAIAFGDNNLSGIRDITAPEPCGGIEQIFNRIWYVRKITNSETQPLLIGIQDNSGSTIGGVGTVIPETPYYSVLKGAYDVSLIIADSPDSIASGYYKAVIPMTYINGEYQCAYTLSQEDTYITFGIKPNYSGCLPFEDALFTGLKTFQWKDWTYNSRTNRINTTTAAASRNINLDVAITPTLYGDLGEVKVTNTKVTYPVGVRAVRYYPRMANVSSFGSCLRVRRYTDVLGDPGAVTIEIDFDNPVLPEFSILGIGSHSTTYESVEITGSCEEGGISGVMPTLTYAGNPKAARYKISGNSAVVSKSGSASATNINGRLNVKFEGGITKILIKYKVTNRISSGRITDIWISPINLRPVPPKPYVNEDGLSFVKTTDKDDYLTCESVTYSFEIGNVTCDNKENITFSDTLPPNMKWVDDSFGLDSKSGDLLDTNNIDFAPIIGETADGRSTLLIENLIVSCSSTLELTAKAAFIDETVPKDYNEYEYPNNAHISYKKTVMSEIVDAELWSSDKYTLDPYTIITASYSKPYEDLAVTESHPTQYKEGDEITVSHIIENPNDESIEDMVFDVNFNEEFKYVAGSFHAEWIEGGQSYSLPIVLEDNPDAVQIEYGSDGSVGSLTIAGQVIPNTADEEVTINGFVLPKGKLRITYTLKAPANVEDLIERDESGNPVLGDDGNPSMKDLEVSYNASTGMSDVCMLEILSNLDNSFLIPYAKGVKAIISNKNVTSKFK